MNKQQLPVVLRGSVVKGFQRGRVLGYPTANIYPEVNLSEGVYYGQVRLRNSIYHAAISIGKNPTFELEKSVVEVHFFNDFDDEFYGEWIDVIIITFLRGLLKVDGVDKLIELIRNDVLQIEKTIITSTPLMNAHEFD
ncbi:riboflavin kinase [Entamoeba marina]